MPTCFNMFRPNKSAHKGSLKCIVAKVTESTNHTKVKKVDVNATSKKGAVVEKIIDTGSNAFEADEDDSTSS